MSLTPIFDAVKKLYSDAELKRVLTGEWTVDLYVPQHRMAILTLKGRRCETSVNSFYASLFKLVDMKHFDKSLKPVILWDGPIPLTTRDLDAASRWGVYVVSSRQLPLLKEVEAGEDIKTVNSKANLVKPLKNLRIGRQLAKLVEAELLNMLSKEPLSLPQAIHGLKDKAPPKSIYWILRRLHRQGKILTLIRSGETIYGTSRSQLPLALMKAASKELLKAKRLNEVYQLIVRRGALTAKEVANTLGYPERLVIADLVKLRDKGLLKRVKTGKKTAKWITVKQLNAL